MSVHVRILPLDLIRNHNLTWSSSTSLHSCQPAHVAVCKNITTPFFSPPPSFLTSTSTTPPPGHPHSACFGHPPSLWEGPTTTRMDQREKRKVPTCLIPRPYTVNNSLGWYWITLASFPGHTQVSVACSCSTEKQWKAGQAGPGNEARVTLPTVQLLTAQNKSGLRTGQELLWFVPLQSGPGVGVRRYCQHDHGRRWQGDCRGGGTPPPKPWGSRGEIHRNIQQGLLYSRQRELTLLAWINSSSCLCSRRRTF